MDFLEGQIHPGIPPAKSMSRDQRHPHMATPENDRLWFLPFEKIVKIVLHDQLWPLFLRVKLDEMGLIRNRVVHVRSLHPHDGERLELLTKDLDPGFFHFCAT